MAGILSDKEANSSSQVRISWPLILGVGAISWRDDGGWAAMTASRMSVSIETPFAAAASRYASSTCGGRSIVTVKTPSDYRIPTLIAGIMVHYSAAAIGPRTRSR